MFCFVFFKTECTQAGQGRDVEERRRERDVDERRRDRILRKLPAQHRPQSHEPETMT